MKKEEVNFCIDKIQEILKKINPDKVWIIEYGVLKHPEAFDDWTVEYHGLRKGEEYVFIFDEYMHLLYVINVTADSTLCILSELTQLLLNKF